jgi:hypothetical protein
MTTVRIAHAEPRPGRLPNGEFHTRGYRPKLSRSDPGGNHMNRALSSSTPVSGESLDVGPTVNWAEPAATLRAGYLAHAKLIVTAFSKQRQPAIHSGGSGYAGLVHGR